MDRILLNCAAASPEPWSLGLARAKLQTRGRLPGAFGYDLAVDRYSMIQRHGVPATSLLPLVLPGSWMVNNKVPSPVFHRWLQPRWDGEWATLLALLDGDAATWLARDAQARTQVHSAVEALAKLMPPDRPSTGVCAALSKVLALLRPDIVPLMDDAAIHFALGTVARPETADTPSAGAEQFVPMLDWFAQAVVDHTRSLAAIATPAPVVQSPAQVLDRLLWFETWGYRVCRVPSPWYCVSDGPRRAVVPIPGTGPRPPGSTIDLAAIDDTAWCATARQALELVFDTDADASI